MYGAPLDPVEWAAVTVPVQVLYGGRSAGPLREGSKALGAVLPDAELIEIPRARHNLKTAAVVPLIAKFFAASTASRAAQKSPTPSPAR
jgi:pimeloyl-ACP methyl ester carboxylesterase